MTDHTISCQFSPYWEGHELAEWSLNVKVRDGWVCQDCGCLDKTLLESHHKKPVRAFPDLAKDIENGVCICLYCHAGRHRDNEAVRNKILARLGIKLWMRYAKTPDSKTGLCDLFDCGM